MFGIITQLQNKGLGYEKYLQVTVDYIGQI